MTNPEFAKHKVATDALETLGMLIPRNSGRDAIHLAVEPVVAAERLFPGQHVGFVEPGKAGTVAKPLGIVDPFLAGTVFPGQRFWMVIYPRQITSLRHVWSHPEFPEAPAEAYHAEKDEHYVSDPKAASEKWLRDLAANCGVGYDRMMRAAEDWRESQRTPGAWGEYLIGGEEMEGESTPPEFWEHYEAVTGLRVPEAERGSFFSCSC